MSFCVVTMLDSHILNTLKIHSLFMRCSKHAFKEFLETPFDSQQDPIEFWIVSIIKTHLKLSNRILDLEV